MNPKTGQLALSLAIVFFGLLGPVQTFAITNVTAQVDPETTEVGQTFDYVIEISSSESGRIAFQDEPDFGELRLVGRQQRSSFQAGATAARTFSFIFALRAAKTGEFTIGGPTVVVGTERFELPDKTVTVVARGDAPEPEVDPESPYSIELDVSPDRAPFVGEQITATFKLLRDARAPNAQPTIPTEPALDDFWTEDLTDSRGYQRQTIRSGGKLYEQISIRIYGLFPLKSGPAEIDPMTVELQTGGFFQRPQAVTLRSKTRKLDVRPLPPNAPEGFSESNVGQWNFSTRVDHRATKVGRPITLELIAEGEGHIERLTLPELESVDGARITHRDVDHRRYQASSSIGGRKVKRLTLMPTRQGTLEIPGVTFHHFDPDSGTYRSTVTDPIEVRVAAGQLPEESTRQKAQARAETEEADVIESLVASLAEPIKVESSIRRATNPFQTSWFWVLALIPLACLLFFWLEGPVRSRRRASAPRRRRAASAAKAMEALDKADSWNDIYATLRSFLAQRFDIPGGRVTRDEVVEALTEAGVGRDDAIRVRDLVHRIEQARFGVSESTPEPADVAEAKSLVKSVSDGTKRSTIRGSSSIVALFAGLVSVLIFSPDSAFATQTPHELFEEGQFRESAEGFETLARDNPHVAVHHFNAGTALVNAGDLGAARLHLERASYLSPWDGDVRDQLDTVRRIVRLRSIEVSRTGETMEGDEPLSWWRLGKYLWPPALAAIILFGLWLALAGQLTRRYSKRGAIRDAAFVALVAGILLVGLGGLGAAARAIALDTVEPGVLLRAQTLRDGPSPHAKELQLPKTAIPGTVVRVIERRGEWVKIALPGQLEGWTKNGAIEAIAPSKD